MKLGIKGARVLIIIDVEIGAQCPPLAPFTAKKCPLRRQRRRGPIACEHRRRKNNGLIKKRTTTAVPVLLY